MHLLVDSSAPVVSSPVGSVSSRLGSVVVEASSKTFCNLGGNAGGPIGGGGGGKPSVQSIVVMVCMVVVKKSISSVKAPVSNIPGKPVVKSPGPIVGSPSPENGSAVVSKNIWGISVVKTSEGSGVVASNSTLGSVQAPISLMI